MIRRTAHKGLRKLYERGDGSAFQPNDVKKLRRILQRLDESQRSEEMDIPGFHFHRLKGDRKDTYAVTVRANYRVTWRVDNDGAFIDVDYEDYH